MFNAILILHVLGAGASLMVVGYGVLAIIKPHGNIESLKKAMLFLALYQTFSGVGLMLIVPGAVSLTKACLLGLSLYGAFLCVYLAAKGALGHRATTN